MTRMAFCEASGWPAFAHAWVDPLDLAFRDLGLTGARQDGAARAAAMIKVEGKGRGLVHDLRSRLGDALSAIRQ